MTNSITAATAVNALSHALAAVRAAAAAAPNCPAMAAAVQVAAGALELANQSLDAALYSESIAWAPGMCEAIVGAGE